MIVIIVAKFLIIYYGNYRILPLSAYPIIHDKLLNLEIKKTRKTIDNIKEKFKESKKEGILIK